LLIPASEYTSNACQSLTRAIFRKYLFRIIRGLNISESAYEFCVKVESIEVLDNIILRKSGAMKVLVEIGVLAIRLLIDEYYEGKVVRCSAEGVVVAFVGGLMEGNIGVCNMHSGTVYNEEQNQWIYTGGKKNNEGYEWKMGAQVRFRVHSVKGQ
jgi:DNA-directed RNA polymerase subunit E'/Rpb7